MQIAKALAAATLAAAAVPALAGGTPVTLDFEGVDSFTSVGAFYAGLGITFTEPALALVNDELGPYFSHAPSPVTVMFVADGPAVMDVATGFDSFISFGYSAQQSELDVVTLWSGLGGTGTKLGAVSLSGNAQLGCSDSPYCNWQKITLEFSGVAHSVTFGGAGNVAFDNVSVAVVPEPATNAMLFGGLALMGLVAARRRRLG